MDLAKIYAINDMSILTTKNEVCNFLGKVNYVAWFIVKLFSMHESIFKLLKKEYQIWIGCELPKGIKKKKKIKLYILNPLMLVSLTHWHFVPTPQHYKKIHEIDTQTTSWGKMKGNSHLFPQ